MNRFLVVLFFASFVFTAIGQTVCDEPIDAAPAKPVAAKQFSASVVLRRSEELQLVPHYIRMHYDSKAKLGKAGSLIQYKGELWWAEMIVDYTKGLEYNVFYQQDSVVCFTRKIDVSTNKSHHHNMDFSKFKFIGKAIIDYKPAYHWTYDDYKTGITIQYYDTIGERQPARFDIYDRRSRSAEIWTFHEFSHGRPDAELFELPQLITDQCNTMEDSILKCELFHIACSAHTSE